MATTGILLRRDNKASLITDPPVLGEGELVYATDTGEHGWYDEPNGELKWATLGGGGTGDGFTNYSVIALSPGSGQPTTAMIFDYTHNNVETTITYSFGSWVLNFGSDGSLNEDTNDFLQFAGSIIVPSDMVDGDIIYGNNRNLYLSGSRENSEISGYDNSWGQKVTIKRVLGQIEFWVESRSWEGEIRHSANVLVSSSSIGLSKTNMGIPGS